MELTLNTWFYASKLVQVELLDEFVQNGMFDIGHHFHNVFCIWNENYIEKSYIFLNPGILVQSSLNNSAFSLTF